LTWFILFRINGRGILSLKFIKSYILSGLFFIDTRRVAEEAFSAAWNKRSARNKTALFYRLKLAESWPHTNMDSCLYVCHDGGEPPLAAVPCSHVVKCQKKGPIWHHWPSFHQAFPCRSTVTGEYSTVVGSYILIRFKSSVETRPLLRAFDPFSQRNTLYAGAKWERIKGEWNG